MFPSIASVASVVPSDAQKSAMKFLQDPPKIPGPQPDTWVSAPRFANPLVGQTAALRSALTNPGGFPLTDLSSIANISFTIPESVPNAAQIQSDIQTALGTAMGDIGTRVQDFGLNAMKDVERLMDGLHAPLERDASGKITGGGVITQQTAKVVDNMQNVMSSFSSYSVLKEQFSTGEPGTAPGTTICDSMKELAGSLGGAADGIMKVANDTVKEIGDMVGGASALAKGALTAAIGNVRTLVSNIQAAIRRLESNGEALAMDLFNDLKTAAMGITSKVTTYMQEAAAAVGKTIGELKTAISAAITTVQESVNDLKTMITDELAKVDKVYQYLKDAALAMSWPSLSPCAKQIASAVSGEAAKLTALANGATPTMALNAVKDNPLSRLLA